MKIGFLPAAQDELDDAFSWYEEQAVGLGSEFLDANRELQGKCPFHCVRLCKKLSLPDATAMYEEKLRLCNGRV